MRIFCRFRRIHFKGLRAQDSSANCSPMKRALILAAVLSLALAGQLQAVSAFDNTDGATAPLSINLSSVTSNNWVAKVFHTPDVGTWSLSSLVLALYNTSAATNSLVTVSLRAVNSSTNPTGANLASETFSVSVTTSPAYYSLDLTDALWGVSLSTNYALIVSATAPIGTNSWTAPGVSTNYPLGQPYVSSHGFEFVATRRSINAGGSWLANSYNNGLYLDATRIGGLAYSEWLTNYPTLSDTNTYADPDGDGFVNVAEFGFDGDPMAGTPALATASNNTAGAVFNYVAVLNSDTNYSVQMTGALTDGPWTNVEVAVTSAPDQSGVLLPANFDRKQFVVPAGPTNNYYRVVFTNR